VKETESYYLNVQLKRFIQNEAKRLGISKSLLAETVLSNGIRQTVKDFKKTRRAFDENKKLV
jgi:hypothetical protein